MDVLSDSRGRVDGRAAYWRLKSIWNMAPTSKMMESPAASNMGTRPSSIPIPQTMMVAGVAMSTRAIIIWDVAGIKKSSATTMKEAIDCGL